jgi:hypothetical protein
MNTLVASQASQGAGSALRSAFSTSWHSAELPAYFVPDTGLEVGENLANSSCWVTTKGTGDVESVFSAYLGQHVLGTLCIRYSSIGQRLLCPGADNVQLDQQAPASAGTSPSQDDSFAASILLYSQKPGEFELHPAYQCHRYELPGNMQVEETLFVPCLAAPTPASKHWFETPILYQVVRLHNVSSMPTQLRIYGYVQFRGETPADISASYDPTLGQGGLVASNQSHPDWIRLFGVVGCDVRVTGWETSFDASQMYERAHVFPLKNETAASGDILGALQLEFALEPGGQAEFAFMTVFSHEGEARARRKFHVAQHYGLALGKTVDYYQSMAEISQVICPDHQITIGTTWAKVNMLRVMSRYSTGLAFTNDPSQSSAVVSRDACWFSSGCDFLLPSFSRALLEMLAMRQKDNGLVLEYYDAVTDERVDYGLNINDNTPAFLLSVNHHFLATGDRAFLHRMYPAVRKAADYILSQRDTHLPDIPPERTYGLVTCTARGMGLHGICSWRNAIPNYTLNGAVTELNAECAAALRAASHLAEDLGTPEGRVDARRFREAADALKEAINAHLLNPKTGLYYLTIDLDGNRRTDVTADELFPVMYKVATDEVAFRVISRLNSPDFWTSAGIRTVSRMSPYYDPYRKLGLMGGVWPGVTWWYAFAAKAYHPEFMVQALRASFEHYARDPKKNNTVPGQFSEWMDGESLVNRGMRLSPWEPPRFLLAAVSGVGGVTVGLDAIKWKPLVPSNWKWVGLRRLPYHGHEISFFAICRDGPHALYATVPLETDPTFSQEIYEEDVTGRVYVQNELAYHVAFRRPKEFLLCLGSASPETTLIPLRIYDVLEHERCYQVEIYNSEWHRWIQGKIAPGKDLMEAAIPVEAGGCRLVRFREAPT